MAVQTTNDGPSDGSAGGSTTNVFQARTRVAKVEHFTPAERAARGKAQRAEVPRTSHAGWQAPPTRADPVAILEAQATSRVQDLLPIRYGRMLVSPFTFYRGAAAIMAADLAPGPRTGLHTQLCGDAHLSNFGSYAAPDRRLVFGINDFDETLPGPFEWDVKRLVASFAIAGRDRGFSTKVRAAINAEVVRSYREAMHRFGAMRNLDLWYARLDIERQIMDFESKVPPEALERMHRNIDKAKTRDALKAFAKLTEVVDGKVRIKNDPPLIVRLDDLIDAADDGEVDEAVVNLIRVYRRSLPGDRRRLLERFQFVDMARKVVGVGSVGTRAWIILMAGRDGEDPLFLQAKEAQSSVLEPYLGKSVHANHGQRVVEGQRLLQAESDILLGWLRTEGIDGNVRDFYFRQLWDCQGLSLRRAHGAGGDGGIRERLRLDAGEGARPFGRRDRDRRLPGHVGCIRSVDGGVRRGVRRPERARLRRARGGSRDRSRRRGERGLGPDQSSENVAVFITKRITVAMTADSSAAIQMLEIDPHDVNELISQPTITAAITPMNRLGIQPRIERPPTTTPEKRPAMRPTTIQPTNVRSIGGVCMGRPRIFRLRCMVATEIVRRPGARAGAPLSRRRPPRASRGSMPTAPAPRAAARTPSPGSAAYVISGARVGGELQHLEVERQVADERVAQLLGAAAVELHVVGGPSEPERVAAGRQLADQVRQRPVVRVAARLGP